MEHNKKIVTKSIIFDELRLGRVSLPPLSFRLIESKPIVSGSFRLDALIEGRWGESSIICAAEIKALSTPKAFSEGVAVLKAAALPANRPPLLLMPFLSETQLHMLEHEGVNGMDLCGNGVVNIPGTLTVWRTGSESRFSSSMPIKNVYRKNSSMVGRVFLAYPQFASVKQIVEKIRERDIFASGMKLPPPAFGTVSKVLSVMEQDLIIDRGKGAIGLLQPDTLLEKLSQNYAIAPDATGVSVKVSLHGKALLDRLAAFCASTGVPLVATGLSSVSRYAVMQREEKLSVYCPLRDELLSYLAPTTSSRFPNLEIIETRDAAVYFDVRKEADFFWASPVQTFLELMNGDKRDQDTAGQVRALMTRKTGSITA